MATGYQYPRYGMLRGGTGHYVRGGFAWSGFAGWGNDAAGQSTTPAGVAVVPQDDYAAALQRQAGEIAANGVVSLVTGQGQAGLVALRSAAQLQRDAEAHRGMRAAGMTPPGILTAQGRGQGLARVREAWARATPGQKAVVGVGGGVGAAWLLGLL